MKRILNLVAILSFLALIGLGAYAFINYPNSFFTTSEDFVHLEVAAPLLYKSSLICIVVCFISGTISYLAREN